MIFQAEVLRRLTEFLEAHDVPHMVIGGIANAIWGRVRATEDADLKVVAGERTISELRNLVESEFQPFEHPELQGVANPLIISIEVVPAMIADLFVGVFPYEEQAIRRAVRIEYEGIHVPVCSAEDLIIHKAIADRPKDWMDIEGIIWRQKGRLDRRYIERWLRKWGEELEKPHLLTRFDEMVQS